MPPLSRPRMALRSMLRYRQPCVSRRTTGLGTMWAKDRPRAVAELKAVVYASKGNVTRIASNFAMERRQLYRLLHSANLMGDLELARLAPVEPAWLTRTKEILLCPKTSRPSSAPPLPD